MAIFPPNFNLGLMSQQFMKKVALPLALVFALGSCQNANVQNNDQKLAQQAIEIHDEIMPQIPKFDKTSVKIDSILTHLQGYAEKDELLDTVQLKSELLDLKDSIETATDNMMTWMRDYDATSQEESYQQNEVDKISTMKQQFDRVQQQINQTLGNLK